MASKLMALKHLLNEYWAEAVAVAVYIMNRCSTKSVKNKVPQEAWMGMNHSVSHLKVFGCVAYAHVPNELRRKTRRDRNVFFSAILKTQKHTSCMIMSQGK